MVEGERYSDIMARCLAHEDKTHRDQVLAEYPENVRRIVHGQMQGIARRLASYIVNAGVREDHLDRADRRMLRRQRIEAIKEPWLRKRVEVMVTEKWAERRREQFNEARRAVE